MIGWVYSMDIRITTSMFLLLCFSIGSLFLRRRYALVSVLVGSLSLAIPWYEILKSINDITYSIKQDYFINHVFWFLITSLITLLVIDRTKKLWSLTKE